MVTGISVTIAQSFLPLIAVAENDNEMCFKCVK